MPLVGGGDPAQVVEEILRQWFEESDEVDAVLSIETEAVADRERVGYRFEGHNGRPIRRGAAGLPVERDGRIDWMRVSARHAPRACRVGAQPAVPVLA